MTARIGPIDRYGLLGARTIVSALASASMTLRRGTRVLRALVLDRVDVVRVSATDEPLLECESTRRRHHVRAQAVVGRRRERRSDTGEIGEGGGDGRQGHAVSEELGANEMDTEISIAEPEPALSAPVGGGLDGVPRLVRPAPAALRVDETGERVEQAVEIGRDVEAEDLDVVADVADHRELAGLEHGCESSGEACATAAAREEDDAHAGTARSARVRAPEACA